MSHPVQTSDRADSPRDPVTYVAADDPAQHDHCAQRDGVPTGDRPARDGHGGHGGHKWMMMLMCVPMVAVAGYLIVFRQASLSTLLPALMCVGMMLVMHLGLGGHGGHGGHGGQSR